MQRECFELRSPRQNVADGKLVERDHAAVELSGKGLEACEIEVEGNHKVFVMILPAELRAAIQRMCQTTGIRQFEGRQLREKWLVRDGWGKGFDKERRQIGL